LREVLALTLGDGDTQWMVFISAGVYFLAFVLLRRRLAGGRRTGTGWNASLAGELCLLGLLAVAALAYAFNYTQAVKSTHALTLLGAAALGQGAGVWALRSPKSNVQSPKSAEGTVVGALTFLLVVAAVWQAEAGHLFQYRGQGRWSGPWDNPNTFGVMMGVGVVLTLGSLRSSQKSLKFFELTRRCSSNATKVRDVFHSFRAVESEVQGLKSNVRRPRSKVQGPKSFGCWAVLVAAAGVMVVGLIKSYSRGAWVGTAVGLAWLVVYHPRISRIAANCGEKRRGGSGFLPVQGSMFNVQRSRLKRALALGVVVVSLGVLGFWGFRQADRGMVRRAYSAAN